MFNFPTEVVGDLTKSGLEPLDIAARPISSAEVAATGAPTIGGMAPDGYVIPYFTLEGKLTKYYRVKLLQGAVRYRAPKGEGNHVYFPPGLSKLLVKAQPGHFIILTEGEKKAACAVKNGYPAVAFSGVYNWKSRQILFPEGTDLKQAKSSGMIQAKIPSGDSNLTVIEGTGIVAEGFNELVDMIVVKQLQVIIIFDSDPGTTSILKPEVQRAAAQLGYELRYRGIQIPKIRQLILSAGKDEKVGLDDFIVKRGTEALNVQLRRCLQRRIAFPRHPNPKTFIAARLQSPRLSRKEAQDVGLAILMELEARGKRLRNRETHEVFYFDEQLHVLMPVILANPRIMLHETPFGAYLYREFNLGAADQRVVQWLAAQFHGEPGIEDSEMFKVLCRPKAKPGCIAYQLSDTHFVIVTPDPEQPYIICENGSYGVLFEQGQVEAIDPKALEAKLIENIDTKQDVLWAHVLSGFNLTESSSDQPGFSNTSLENLRKLATLLYYISPWLLRWRGTQLPIELLIGEPGSGKSSLYELRQNILIGRARLSNMTNDIRDWYAGITSVGGLHVLDNVHFTAGAKDYRQRLSDEYCRLTTETSPHIEMRKLYTTSDVLSLPVNTTFGITAIEQPFYNTDFLQRSAIFEVTAVSSNHDARWVERQIERGGGRVGWIAHHISILHKFLRLAIYEEEWNPSYKAKHRLANYEQALMLMARVLRMDPSWIPGALSKQTTSAIGEADQIAAALHEFVQRVKDKQPNWPTARFGVSDIATWAQNHEVYSRNPIMTNSWRLGRYIKGRLQSLRESHGIFPDGTRNNKAVYGIEEVNM